jgi:hypothetical protein
MITNSGRTVFLKEMARRLSGISLGTGGVDPMLGTAVAPSAEATSLKNQIFFEPRIQFVDVITPATGIRPRLFIRHTFENTLVPPSGILITGVNEVGVFAIDPTTGQNVLAMIKTFDSRTFKVPPSGAPVVRNSITIRWEIF